MAELHEALKALSPTDWDDVPVDDLKPYMTELLTAGELICNSIPPPSEGTAFHQAKPHYDEPNRAKSHKDVYPSLARSFPPGKEHENLQKNWGKAMKFSAKENPLNIAVYKMAGHDRHGAWFARRSVHEGMGFAKFKNAMKREFAESLAVEGPPGSGSIRGIGADTRLERKEVEGLGALEVYQLSAQFPGPTTPREFIPLILTSDCSLTDMSAATLSDGKTHIPRSHMILSRPVTHPDAPERQGYILGKYESVELIREIPLSQAKEGGDSVEDTSELNPVEWIMITRSDPGGGIPRFMVDRGTPSAMLGDVHKWLDWATNFDEDTEVGTQPPEKITPAAQEAAAASADGSGETDGPTPASPDARKRASTVPAAPAQAQTQQEGVVSHLSQALEAGIDAYAPTMVSSYMHNRTDSNAALAEESDYSDSSSVASFMSAEEMRRLSTAEALPDKSESPAASSQISLTSLDTAKKDASHHDKEVQKIAKQREKLDRKLAKKREEEEARLQKMKESESGEREKAKERHDREVKKSEERHRRELEKLEAKKEKEAQKAAQKKQKRDERDVVMRVTRERDEFRSQSELLKREVELLHEQIGELQRENTSMASKLGKVGGQDALSDVAVKGSSSASIGGRSRTSTRTEK